METIATNIANAETTRTEGGGPYRRRVVQISAGGASLLAGPAMPGATTAPATSAAGTGAREDVREGAFVTAITEDASEGPRVYEPGHPDADADGYVRYPNVNATQEMIDMMDARRLFEANATVFQSVKAMLRRAMDI
jgi:flagellar basal-body rod protein FlgC